MPIYIALLFMGDGLEQQKIEKLEFRTPHLNIKPSIYDYYFEKCLHLDVVENGRQSTGRKPFVNDNMPDKYCH